ncbi:hypothetical protein I8J29_09365 [Paenibacillus sp. MWE-103]|uniref:Uncharacterized protein n=1 Tax=Paenibacillus artemisiicola TaxID=1172618 RepID=A0ABS3W7Y6_9BACL|nr:hypothetical protein [Paenibacillus artemisiicola]MBO7744402.1 hypothetical protein [Paenibacillus artemisiicola]
MTELSKKGLRGEVSVLRLYLLRGGYLLIVVGLGMTVWPDAINRSGSWELMEGVVQCMLLAFWALCVLGLRYPLQLLPMLIWEMAWKTVWLIIVALPIWTSGRMNDSTMDTVSACLLVVVFPFVVPWRYVFANYVKKHGDRWV